MTKNEIRNITTTKTKTSIDYRAESDDYTILFTYFYYEIPINELSNENQSEPENINIYIRSKNKRPQLCVRCSAKSTFQVEASMGNGRIDSNTYKTLIPRYEKMYDDAHWIINNLLPDFINPAYIKEPPKLNMPSFEDWCKELGIDV